MKVKAVFKTLTTGNKDKVVQFGKVFKLVNESQNKLIKEGGKFKRKEKGMLFEITLTFEEISPEKTKLFLERLKELER